MYYCWCDYSGWEWGNMGCCHGSSDILLFPTMKWTGLMRYEQCTWFNYSRSISIKRLVSKWYFRADKDWSYHLNVLTILALIFDKKDYYVTYYITCNLSFLTVSRLLLLISCIMKQSNCFPVTELTVACFKHLCGFQGFRWSGCLSNNHQILN